MSTSQDPTDPLGIAPLNPFEATYCADREGTCALMGRIYQECDGAICKHECTPEPITPVLSEPKLPKPKPVKAKKTPIMKSGWMDLKAVIPDFNIDDETFNKLLFCEHLLVSCFESNIQTPTPIGALSLDIQAARGGPLKYQKKKNKSDFVLPKFLVHLSSQLEFMGYNGGSRITAWIDRDLQTLEEKRREYLLMDDYLDQQVLYVNSQENFYYLRHDKKKDIFYSPEKAVNLLCEGSNFILMRYLAVTRYVGVFETTTLYINGNICRNIYESRGPASGIVNNQKLDLCKIYRTIIEECGIVHKCVTLMTLYGQILKQEWATCDYILQINPLAEIPLSKPNGHLKIPLEKKTNDLEMLSLFLDAKTQNKKMIENYMEDHPEIKDMLEDYTQTILQLKPEDIYEFTAKYFLAFTPSLLPLSEYYEPPHEQSENDEDYEFWKYL